MNIENSVEAKRFMTYSAYGYAPALLTDGGSLGFNGERFQPEICSYPLGSGYRQYSPALMRFTSADSLSPFAAGGINAYAYCSGDPVNRVDPTGHVSFAWLYRGVAKLLNLVTRVVPKKLQANPQALALLFRHTNR